MDRDYAEKTLASATASRDAARATMNAARMGTKKWRDAEEDLNFWQGKVANMQAALRLIDEAR